MALFEWTTDYEMNIEQIDSQHRQLVGMINDLYAALKKGESDRAVDATINRLMNYVNVHFETEEALMHESGYPAAEGHLRQHDELRDRVYELKKEQLQGRQIATFELLNFLSEWLKNHISQSDMAFGRHAQDLQRRNLG